MAITAGQVTTTSTLEQFRVEFNKLQTDVSGIEAGSLSFTNISATTDFCCRVDSYIYTCKRKMPYLRRDNR